MRIRSLVVAAAACFAATAPAAAQEPRGIVFVLDTRQEGSVLLVPVAVLGEAGGYDAIPSRTVADGSMPGFASRWLAAGRRYAVLRGGVEAGTATVVQWVREPCGNPNAEATLALTGPRRPPWGALAGAGLPEQRGAPWVREASPDERQALDRMAAAMFAAHGVEGTGRTSTVTTATVLFGGIARPVLVGTYTLTVGHPLPRQAAAFVVAEEGQDGYRPAFTDFREGLPSDHRRVTLIDAADLDGDGLPELVLENYYSQWAEYSILTRLPDGWVTAYRGGQNGC